MTKKLVTIFLCMLFSYNPVLANHHISDKEQLEDYVDNLMQSTNDLFHDTSISKGQLEKKVSKLIREQLYFKWMAKQSLGRNIKSMSPAQVNQFEKVYTDFVVSSYASLINSYNGEKGALVRVKEIDNDLYIVDTEIFSPKNNTKTTVKYLIHEINENGKKKFLIGDIITEGISILETQRSEFRHVISTDGIDALIHDLKHKS